MLVSGRVQVTPNLPRIVTNHHVCNTNGNLNIFEVQTMTPKFHSLSSSNCLRIFGNGKKTKRHSPSSDYQLNTADLLDWLLQKSWKHPTNSYNIGEQKLPKKKSDLGFPSKLSPLFSHLAIPHTLPSERQKRRFFSAWKGVRLEQWVVQADGGMEVKIHSGSQ